MEEPTIKSNGQTQPSDEVSSDFYGVGPGVAFYLMPANVYFSGSVLFSSYNLNFPDEDLTGKPDVETNTGIGVNLMVGKEWWVSENWGRLAAQFLAGAAREKQANTILPGNRDTWRSFTFGLAFSATYN